ncbi:MAG: hypothetical protein HY673_02260 [Chloroflexi bacterium]|nr:hypothetical protein [Chloroflexota bacterium]
MLTISRAVSLFIVLALLLAGCSPPKQEARGVFVEGQSGGDAETLNFILAADSSSFSYAGHTTDSLAGFDNNYNLVLRLAAKDVEISSDGLVYTVTIRDDLFWTGGIKVTAEDFVYTLKNLMFSDWLTYNYKSDWQETVDSKTVYVEPKVVNDMTFTITRKTVYPEFVYNLYSLTPYPKHIAVKYEGDIKAFTEAEEFNNLSFTGNLGPYRFEEWIRNDKFLVARNPDYYLGKPVGAPFFEKYTIKLFGTPATRQAALEAGDITSTGIEPQNVARFKRMPNLEVYTTPTSGYSLMLFNLRDNGWPGFKEKKVRQALTMAISKAQLVESVLEGFGEPAFSFIPSPSPWYSEEGLHKYGVGALYDKAKATQMLYEAGYGARKGDGFEARDKDGKPLKFTLFTTTGSNVSESMALLMKQELGSIGIEVEVKLVPWPTLLGKYVRNKVPGSNQEPQFNNGKNAVSEEKWDLIIMALGTNPIAPSGSDVFFVTDGGLNFFGYSNPKVDELFRRTRSAEALERENRKRIYQELASLLSEEQPVEFIAYNKANTGFLKKVKGIEPGINMGYNYYLWHFE